MGLRDGVSALMMCSRAKAQKREFRHYLGGLLGESERKNLSQLADNAVGVTYHRLHHFLTEAPWSLVCTS